MRFLDAIPKLRKAAAAFGMVADGKTARVQEVMREETYAYQHLDASGLSHGVEPTPATLVIESSDLDIFYAIWMTHGRLSVELPAQATFDWQYRTQAIRWSGPEAEKICQQNGEPVSIEYQWLKKEGYYIATALAFERVDPAGNEQSPFPIEINLGKRNSAEILYGGENESIEKPRQQLAQELDALGLKCPPGFWEEKPIMPQRVAPPLLDQKDQEVLQAMAELSPVMRVLYAPLTSKKNRQFVDRRVFSEEKEP